MSPYGSYTCSGSSVFGGGGSCVASCNPVHQGVSTTDTCGADGQWTAEVPLTCTSNKAIPLGEAFDQLRSERAVLVQMAMCCSGWPAELEWDLSLIHI